MFCSFWLKSYFLRLLAEVQDTFMTYEIYDDIITIRLVQEACKMLGERNFNHVPKLLSFLQQGWGLQYDVVNAFLLLSKFCFFFSTQIHLLPLTNIMCFIRVLSSCLEMLCMSPGSHAALINSDRDKDNFFKKNRKHKGSQRFSAVCGQSLYVRWPWRLVLETVLTMSP